MMSINVCKKCMHHYENAKCDCGNAIAPVTKSEIWFAVPGYKCAHCSDETVLRPLQGCAVCHAPKIKRMGVISRAA